MLILECPNCQNCYTVEEWNGFIGRRDEPIPLDITQEEWGTYANDHTGVIDCEGCNEVAIYEDMTPV